VGHEGGPGAGRQVDAQVVDGHAGQRHADAHQGVDGVAVEGQHHQEDGAQAVDHREEQGELGGRERERERDGHGGEDEQESGLRKS